MFHLMNVEFMGQLCGVSYPDPSLYASKDLIQVTRFVWQAILTTEQFYSPKSLFVSLKLFDKDSVITHLSEYFYVICKYTLTSFELNSYGYLMKHRYSISRRHY